ncbi:hypothetical protein D9M71_476930 [compost metagenome]
MPRWQEQILAALALVRADDTQVLENALVHVHHHAGHQPFRQGQYQRAGLLQVGEGGDIRRGEVGGEDALLLFLGDVGSHLTIRDLEDVGLGILPLDNPGRGNAPHVRLGRTHEVHLVQQMAHGLLGRVATIELQLADCGIDRFHLARQHLG